jgi:hypothetical protein
VCSSDLYLEDLAGELNEYVQEICKNFCNNLRDNPKECLKKSLENLLFNSKLDKENFSSKIYDTIEEINYASKILTAEGYRIWNVKYNTPIIGNIVRKKLKNFYGNEDLPKFCKLEKDIDEIKNNTCSFLSYLGFDSEKKISKDEIKVKYQERMKSYGSFTDNRRLLAYDLESGRYLPKNAQEELENFEKNIEEEYFKMNLKPNDINFEEYRKTKKKQRNLEFIKSNYNSWWEKFFGYIGYFFGF